MSWRHRCENGFSTGRCSAAGPAVPPTDRDELDVAGPCRWSGPALLCPPEGLCFLYALLAALYPTEWEALRKDEHGFINDSYSRGPKPLNP